jgi:hypothetical protein
MVKRELTGSRPHRVPGPVHKKSAGATGTLNKDDFSRKFQRLLGRGKKCVCIGDRYVKKKFIFTFFILNSWKYPGKQ